MLIESAYELIGAELKYRESIKNKIKCLIKNDVGQLFVNNYTFKLLYNKYLVTGV